MPHPAFGAKDVCYTEKKTGTKNAFLGAASLLLLQIEKIKIPKGFFRLPRGMGLSPRKAGAATG